MAKKKQRRLLLLPAALVASACSARPPCGSQGPDWCLTDGGHACDEGCFVYIEDGGAFDPKEAYRCLC